MKAEVNDLTDLLKRTRRMANVNGKPIPQVIGCVLQTSDGIMTTTSVVRDGKSSVARFVGVCESTDEETIIIPDIEKMLGALKAHTAKVTLKQDGDMLRMKSSNKQTSLSADNRALAFPHASETVLEWASMSQDRMKAVRSNAYMMADGSERGAVLSVTVDGRDLREAIADGNMNGQKVSTFRLLAMDHALGVVVGTPLKGQTNTQIGTLQGSYELNIVFGGGLESVIPNGEVLFTLISYEEEGQGYALILDSPEGRIYQRSVLE